MTMYDFIKKNFSLLIIVLIVISFNLIAHSLWGNYFCSKGTATIPTVNNTTKTGDTSIVLTGESISKPVIVSKKPTINKNTTTWEIENTTQEWTKPILIWAVSAWYDGETEYERVRNQLIKLWLTYEQAESIVWEWYANTSWGKQFVKAIVWVSNAEWGIFQHWLYNNYLGVMLNGSLRHYDTFALAIEHWRILYNRNKWYLRLNAQQWLNGNYCVGYCYYWVTNYNAGIDMLGI